MSESKNWSSGALINSGWLNAVDATVFEALGDGTLNPPTTPAQVVANLNLVTLAGLSAPDGASKVGYLPSGIGAVATTVARKLSDWVSVKDFGAIGDGVADDTAAILAAVAYLKSAKQGGTIGQGCLHFPPTDSSCYYNITAPIVFEDVVQIEVTGGQGAHIRNTTNDNEIFIFRGTAGFGNVFGFNIHNLFLSGHSVAGTKPVVYLERCILSWFTDIYIDTSPRDGMLVNSTSAENFFTRCIVETAARDGFNISSTLNHLTDCHAVAAGQFGFNFNAGSNENTIVGCTSYLSGQHGWSVSGDKNIFSACIGRNNSIGSVGYSGISLAGTGNICAGFQGYDTQGVATQKYGIRVAGTDNKVIGISGSGNVTRLLEVASTTAQIVGASKLGASADRGDASVTLYAGVDSETQRFETTLTANRAVTISTLGAYNGARFRIVRTGLGAFTLDVNGLKVIPNSTAAFVEVEFNGTAWFLSAYGVL